MTVSEELTDGTDFGWAWSKIGVTSLVTGLLNLLYLKNEQMEQIDFLHAVINSEKLKVDSIIFGWAWSKMAIAFSSSDPKMCCILKTNL